MPQKNKKNPYATPALPTRERVLYLTAAQVYADAFRAVFVDPATARRRFRFAAERDQGSALSVLLLHPDVFGPRCVRRFASEAHDPAFIYFTLRDRRPRVFLMRIAELLHTEAGRRAHLDDIKGTREWAERYGRRAGERCAAREHGRSIAREAVEHAASVYARPAQACRVILRVVRRHGAARARALLELMPDFFGALRVVKHKRGIWPLLLVFCSTEEAKGAVSGFLNSFDATVRMRARRWKGEDVRRPEWLAA
ncbi:MAG TPA: hypothetical protein VM759_05935, partial [Longimicrobium sp.]|nr:hypothetical protein [Longimicrobium sp.]